MLKRIEKRGKVVLARFLSLFLRVEDIAPEELSQLSIKNLLVIRQHNQMGDMLLAVPALRGLRGRFPHSHITLVTATINRDVVFNNPYIDRVITYSKEKYRWSILRLFAFLRILRSKDYDAVIVLNTVSFSITSMLLAVASGAKIRIGSTSKPFGHDLSSKYYHIQLPLPDKKQLEKMHESEHNLYPLSFIGVKEKDLTSVIIPSKSQKADARRFISEACSDYDYMVIHPGAGKEENIWPARRFAEVIRKVGKIRRMKVVVVGGPVDRAVVDAFLKCYKSPAAVLYSPSVGMLGEVMKGALVTLCNDTGIMHIAGAVGARCVAVFGSTDPFRWKPVGENVVAVKSGDGRIESVDTEAVFTAVTNLMGGAESG
jgi:ADP-heptose:LPS heptosyltransferase